MFRLFTEPSTYRVMCEIVTNVIWFASLQIHPPRGLAESKAVLAEWEPYRGKEFPTRFIRDEMKSLIANHRVWRKKFLFGLVGLLSALGSLIFWIISTDWESVAFGVATIILCTWIVLRHSAPYMYHARQHNLPAAVRFYDYLCDEENHVPDRVTVQF